MDRIIEVAFSDNVDLDAAVANNQTVIAAYATRDDRPDFPFWPMLFDNITIRLLGSDDFPPEAKQQAATDLTTAAGAGALTVPIGDPLPLERSAEPTTASTPAPGTGSCCRSPATRPSSTTQPPLVRCG